MSKDLKLRDRVVGIPADFTWDEMVALLKGFGFQERKKGGGSYRTFFDESGRKIFLHKPHPTEIVKQYAVRDVVDTLKNFGLLK